MDKRGKGRLLIVIGIIVFLALSVIAEEQLSSSETSDTLSETSKKENPEISGLSNQTQQYIKDFVSQEGISVEQINSVSAIDLNNPPEEVKLGEEVADTNIAIYEINYTKEDENKNVFVITYSTEEFKLPLELKPATAIEYLSFGETAETSGSVYLRTNTGVRSSEEKGYVMMDEGSITGISTNLEVVKGEGRIDVIVYVNGKDVGLRNLIYVDSNGVKKDYDKQSKDVIKFQPGDVISVYVETEGSITWKDVINLVKIELD